MKFLVVDDHPLMRRGVRQILEEHYPATEVVECARGEEGLEAVRQGSFDLAVIDLSMPGMSGLEAVERYARIQPGLRILVLSMHADSEFASRALRGGASGYLTKDDAADLLAQAVQRILSGGRFLSTDVAGRIAERLTDGLAPLHARLSARELRVMCLLAEGLGISEIAARLSLSPKTVSTYRHRVLEKTGMSSNADLTRYCIQHALVS